MNYIRLVGSQLAALFLACTAFSQNTVEFPPCGTDAYYQMKFAAQPALRQSHAEMEAQRYERANNTLNAAAKSDPTLKTLPVVFHIVHDNGAENISDDRVLAALEHLNQAFAHIGYYAQNGPGDDVQFRFCLARRTPEGGATSGITRTPSVLTVHAQSEDTLKNLIRWEPTRYVNIWIVRSISSSGPYPVLAGYATLPFSHGAPYDGIVIDADYVGVSPQNDAVLAHEMGHYLGLYHTFEGGCQNQNCLLDGDRVCDTPPDQSTFTACPFNSCSTDADAPAPNPFITDVPDASQNFMDYVPWSCRSGFTAGQGERMQDLSLALRYSLMDSYGCLEPCAAPIVAAFTTSGTTAPVGDTIFCWNQSAGALEYAWYVDHVQVSVAPDFAYIGNTLGYHLIQLKAIGATANCVSIFSKVVKVECNLQGFISYDAGQVQTGQPVTFTAAVEHVDQYSWTVNGAATGGGGTLTQVFNTAGSYQIGLHVSNEYCSADYSVIAAAYAFCAPLAPQQWSYTGWGYPFMTVAETWANGDLLLGGDDVGPCLARFRPDGTLTWKKGLGIDPYFAKMNNACVLPDNGLMAAVVEDYDSASTVMMRLDSLGDVVWSKKLTGISIQMTAAQQDGTTILVGNALTDSFNYIAVLIGLDAGGNLSWQMADTIFYSSQQCVAAAGGGFFVSFWDNSYSKYCVMRIDADGQIVWKQFYAPEISVQYYQLNNLVPEPDGGISLSFSYYDGEHNMVLVRCDADGAISWVKKYSVTTSPTFDLQEHVWIKKTGDGGYIFSGNRSNSVVGNNWNAQTFVRLNPSGAVLWSFGVKSTATISNFPIAATGAEWQGSIILPLLNPDDNDGLSLMRTNANGFAGGCLEQQVSVYHQTSSATTAPAPHTFLPAVIAGIQDFSFPIENQSLGRFPTCTERPICAENCINGADDDNDGYTDCYDPQCDCYHPVQCGAMNVPGNLSFRIAWESPVGRVQANALAVVGNLNPKSGTLPEIVVPAAPRDGEAQTDSLFIFRGDGTNRTHPGFVRVSFSLQSRNFAWPSLGDINRDGIPELNVNTNSTGYVLSYRKFQDTSSTSSSMPSAMSSWPLDKSKPVWRTHLADFDADGEAEIMAGANIYRQERLNPSQIYWRFGAKGDTTKPYGRLAYNNFQYGTANPVATELLTRNLCNGDPDCDGLELAAGPAIYSVDITGWDADPGQLSIRRNLNDLDPGSAVWSDGYTAVADVDLDGILDVVVAGRRNNVYGVYAWNRNGLLRFFPYPVNTPLSGGQPCIANVFDDRKAGFAADWPEIIVPSANRLTCFNLQIAASNPGQPYWWSITTTDDQGLSPAVAFDFNADGLDELVYHDLTQLRVLFGDIEPLPAGVDAARNWFALPAPTAPTDAYPVVADCDGDGEAEIIFTSFGPDGPDSAGSLRGQLRVLESANVPWAGTRPVWNQFGYAPTQIEDDLSVPVQQQEPHKTLGGHRPFNRFLGQSPALNDNWEPYVGLPDAAASIDSAWCGDERLHLRLKVCNTGQGPLSDSLPLRFYESNPTISAAPSWGEEQFFTQKLPAGGCATQEFSIPVYNAVLYYGLLNAPSAPAPPFVLNDSFQPARSRECDYTNNLFTTYWTWETPSLDLGPDQLACSANAVALDAGAGFGRYRWQDGSENQIFTALGPGQYWVDAWDECGFKQSDTIRLELNPAGQLDLGPDRILCKGDTLALTASGFDNVVWSPGYATLCAVCPSTFFTTDSSLLIVATGITGDCFASDSLLIFVPVLDLALSSTPAQLGQSDGTASVVVNGGAGTSLLYAWNTVPLQTTATATGLSPGPYLVTVTGQEGCSAVGQVIVEQAVAVSDVESHSNWNIRPNPAGDIFFIEGIFTKTTSLDVLIVNSLGQTVWQKSAVFSDRLSMPVDCRAWPKGAYEVVLKSAARLETKIVVLQAN